MPRYRVELTQTVSEVAIVFVEANNPDEAEELALNRAADWKFKDVLDGAEVLSVQQINHEEVEL